MRLVQITDLHLSDRPDTPAADALAWAIGAANDLGPDLVAITGDMTTWGTAAAARQFLAAAEGLRAPWVFTPGNAELRSPGAAPVLAACSARRSVRLGDIQFLLPDTSTGRLDEHQRNWLEQEADDDAILVILTHYPVDVLDEVSCNWIEAWIDAHGAELYLAGHRHFDRVRSVGGCTEIIGSGLDPDKAFGTPPGILLLAREAGGSWTPEPISWPHDQQLVPAETPHCPVGWSIHGDPLETVRETQRGTVNVCELRPRDADYDAAATATELQVLRSERPLYLSWHLPNLAWQSDSASVLGQDAMQRQIDDGLACGVNAFTVHVPRIDADGMFAEQDQPSDAWHVFVDVYERMFGQALASGVNISIENIHNNPGTPAAREHRAFATEISEYLAWIHAVAERLTGSGDGSAHGRVGAHFDVGHARNNGELGNMQPLGDWYARVGRRITGYHIHQVRPHEDTGKLTNHRDIKSIYDRTISYAGFLHAWSSGMLNRAPLFVEVRDAQERRRTTGLLQTLFT